MLLYLKGHNYKFECENLCRIFFPYAPLRAVDISEAEDNELIVSVVINEDNSQYIYKIDIYEGNKHISDSFTESVLSEDLLMMSLYKLFERFTSKSQNWGLLTGIHPVKLLHQLCDANGVSAGERIFRENCFVSEKKFQLAKRVLLQQKAVVDALHENDFSLYVSIPFCPTRCAYCSFVSQSIDGAKKIVEPYFELLLSELEETSLITKSLGLRLISVYIGGGTPTTLTVAQLSVLIAKIRKSFDMGTCKEFTVEAGRPDTITAEKLEVLKMNDVSRISINPQSMSDEVLAAIGRAHTAKDVEKAFNIASKIGFNSINADLIVGLPKDSLNSFKYTLDKVIGFGADNITVHSLAIKRSSRINMENSGLELHSQDDLTTEMMDYSIETLTGKGFNPYYLYRQSRMAGNLENTGWAKNGKICNYNIYTMDECNTVIACGAGAVTKLKDSYSNRLERIFNFKYPFEYVTRFNEILDRKKGVISLYEQFRERIR